VEVDVEGHDLRETWQNALGKVVKLSACVAIDTGMWKRATVSVKNRNVMVILLGAFEMFDTLGVAA